MGEPEKSPAPFEEQQPEVQLPKDNVIHHDFRNGEKKSEQATENKVVTTEDILERAKDPLKEARDQLEVMGYPTPQAIEQGLMDMDKRKQDLTKGSIRKLMESFKLTSKWFYDNKDMVDHNAESQEITDLATKISRVRRLRDEVYGKKVEINKDSFTGTA